jgi:hypothetical protein
MSQDFRLILPAHGYRDHEFLKLKILGLPETQYALVG